MSNTENAAKTSTQACQYSDAQVLIAVRAELIESASDAVAFLAKWTMSDDSVYELLGRLDETGDEYADVAAWWLQNNDEWKTWVARRRGRQGARSPLGETGAGNATQEGRPSKAAPPHVGGRRSRAVLYPPPMRVLVTGATGFIGRELARTLAARGDQVVAPHAQPAGGARHAPRTRRGLGVAPR